MAKNKFRQSADNPFNQNNAEIDQSWSGTASQIFGDLEASESRYERLQPTSIFSIHPDPVQPRRAIPSVIRKEWDGQPETISAMLHRWLDTVQTERAGRNQAPLNLTDFLSEETQASDAQELEDTLDQEAKRVGPMEEAFMTIVRLAGSIRRSGLTNPITIAPRGDTYQLETGERRWLAFHLLHTWFDGSAPDRPNERKKRWREILARVVDEVDVWRQANENNTRQNLNAIGKARQYAVLMMNLNANKGPFFALNEFDDEQEYYRQAINLSTPRGKGEQLLAAMGVRSRSTLSKYRAILDLPSEIWHQADDLNLPEELLYDLAQIKIKESPNAALQAFYARGNVSGQNTAPARRSRARTTRRSDKGPNAPGTKRHFAEVASALRNAGPAKADANQHALDLLNELRMWLDEQEDRISRW